MSQAAEMVRDTSRMGVVLGIATVVLGGLAMCAPFVSGVAVVVVVGILLIAAGLARTVFAFRADSFGQGLLTFLFGGLSIVCGAVVLARPVLGLTSLTLVLVAYFITDGIASIMGAFQVKPQRGWGWMLLSGLCTLALAFLIWKNWPFSGATAIGVLVGVNLVFSGWSMIAVGAAGEEAVETATI